MNTFVWVLIGLIGGWLISTVVKHSTNNVIDIVFGLIGSLLGAFIANNIFGVPSTSVYTYLSAAFGAFIFIFLSLTVFAFNSAKATMRFTL